MKKLALAIASIIVLLQSCIPGLDQFKSNWHNSPDGTWIGSDFWANRLADWQVKDGRLECISTLPLRTAHLLTTGYSPADGSLKMNIHIMSATSERLSPESAAGFLLGAGGEMNYRSASLIFHSWGAGAGIFAGIDGLGRLFLRDLNHEKLYIAYEGNEASDWNECYLLLKIEERDAGLAITLKAVDPLTNSVLSSLTHVGLNKSILTGNIALVSHSGKEKGDGDRFCFSRMMVSGSGITKYPERNTGPIISTQYTLSNHTLKMTAQMAPLAVADRRAVQFQIMEDGKWVTRSESIVHDTSFTAHFKVTDWDYSSDIRYRVSYDIKRGREKTYYHEGSIRRDPVDATSVTLLSLSCIQQVIKPYRETWRGIDAGWFPFSQNILFPHQQLTDNLISHKPDVLFFAGDQVYEGASPTMAVTDEGRYLDYLYKWYLWCITYRDLTAHIPAIIITDDHDVYHGNLWGAGGLSTPDGLKGAEAQDAGGYKMEAAFVNFVQKTQTSHLPDPYNEKKVGQGIELYYTTCNIGGVSFAILEDRKFKSAPRDLLLNAKIFNGWPQNREWNVKWNSRIPNASLLGEEQMQYLEEWADDWSGGTWMKAVLSQTLFANLSTLPAEATSDAVVTGMEIPDSGSYVTGDRIVSDFDSNGWPQVERDKAISIFRKAFAIHVAGDQHLASTVWYGIDNYRDAGLAIISPATGNIFPRRWFPPNSGGNRIEGSPAYTGDYEDGFGNKTTVMAVANPHTTKALPLRHNELATGYSKISFRKADRDIELSNWPYYAGATSGKPFPGWPIVVNQTDNYGRSASAWLPEIKVSGIDNPVFRIVREITGEIIYTLRINGNSFQPKVFAFGNYRIDVGDPDLNQWKSVEKINATSFKERSGIEVQF